MAIFKGSGRVILDKKQCPSVVLFGPQRQWEPSSWPLNCSIHYMVLVAKEIQCSAFPGTGWGREFLTNIHFWCATKMPYGVKLVITAASNRVLFLICDIWTKKSLQACLLVLSSHILLAKSLMKTGNDLEKSVLHRHFSVFHFKGSYY